MYKIQTITAGSAVASLDFTVPSGYDDLLIVTSVRSAQADVALEVFIAFNGSTSSFSARQLYGSGSSAASSTPARQVGLLPGANATASTFNSGTIYIPNYLGSANKSYSVDSVTENNGTTAYQNIVAGLWSVTDPITSISLTTTGGNNFVQGSTATLYGIKSARTFAKATGGTIYYDSTNNKVYHVFTSSGTFTPTQSISGVEYLVIAGGGGGAGGDAGAGGGGGAGGYRSSVSGELSGGGASAESTLSLTAQAYTVTVGAGGAGGAAAARGTSGSNSVFGSITATGGGAGGFRNDFPALTGGSGGGGNGESLGGQAGAAGTANQGYSGGTGALSGSGNDRIYTAGGGGGAGSIGANAVAGSKGGNGGSGVTSSITGTAIARAGGGGGAGGKELNGSPTGGTATAGGGAGGSVSAGTAATANTGGGGGGGGYSQVTSALVGANGGSGIVIVRYSA